MTVHKDHGPFLGQPNGIATLDGTGKVPTAQLPTLGSGATSYQMSVNLIEVRQNLGAEIVASSATLTVFQARRGVPGSSGTTTIQLELNGSAVSGATLSWAFTDGAYSLKTIVISQAVSVGDRLSFRITAAEVNAEDIFAEVHV